MNWLEVYIFLHFLIKLLSNVCAKRKTCRSQKCLIGKTVVITGANTGIGYQAALDFAKRGAKVILACRNRVKAEAARQRIIEETENSNIIVKTVDLTSFKSVRAFAKEMYETEDRLDILVNNAGISYGYDRKTDDGYDVVMQSNYYSHFLLTNLLIDLMKKSGDPARIVNNSSMMASLATFFDVDKIENFQANANTYSISKLCNILFTKELAKRLENSNITVYSVHPGLFRTEIARPATVLEKIGVGFLMGLFFEPLGEGSQTIIYCSLEKNIERYSGHHFDNCERVGDYKTVIKSAKLAGKLWKLTEKMVGMKEEETFDRE